MYITYENKKQVDDIYVHDSTFTGFLYNYEDREIVLSCKNIYLKKELHFVFSNVVHVNLQSCSFWHGGDSIYALYLGDASVQEQILRAYGENNNWLEGSYLDEGISFILVVIQINSGDVLEILCEGIEYIEYALLEE